MNPPMIVALIALFVALSGTAVAASNGLILGSQIKDHTISVSKLTPAALTALKGARGAIGPQGPQGPAGANGTNGTNGAPGSGGPAGHDGANGANGGFDLGKISYVVGPMKTVAAATIDSADAVCPSGSKVIGGGFFNSITSVGGALQPQVSGQPVDNTWRVIVNNDTSIPVGVFATAICASA